MTALKTMIEADRVPVAVSLTAGPGDYLLIVGGVCIGAEGSSGGSRDASQSSFTTSNRRTRKGGSVLAKHLTDDLLLTLYDLGKATPTKKVLDKIQPRIAPKLAPVDYETLKSGDSRWRNKVQWARFLAVNEGLMKDEERGLWELSDAGRRRVEEIRQGNSGGR